MTFCLYFPGRLGGNSTINKREVFEELLYLHTISYLVIWEGVTKNRLIKKITVWGDDFASTIE